MCERGRVEAWIVIDGQTLELPADNDPDELRRRVAQAVFRCEVEQLHLADGHTILINWRSVRTVQIHTGPPAGRPAPAARPAPAGARPLDDAATPTTGESPAP
jgi:hypothetical protein